LCSQCPIGGVSDRKPSPVTPSHDLPGQRLTHDTVVTPCRWRPPSGRRKTGYAPPRTRLNRPLCDIGAVALPLSVAHTGRLRVGWTTCVGGTFVHSVRLEACPIGSRHLYRQGFSTVPPTVQKLSPLSHVRTVDRCTGVASQWTGGTVLESGSTGVRSPSPVR
jgi:hypothetical protein